ncbi:MAG TPA: hypothetical protein VLD35_14805 [Caldimonas sp.]|nr:hypothetical protein [Caldimonas sp.]
MTTTTDPSPLKYMGTQSQETVNMAAAMAHAVQSTEGRAEQALGKLSGEIDEAGSKVGDAAHWAAGKAKEALRSAAEGVRDRATTAVETYTREDPIRAILIAAATGAVLMALVAMKVRSGVRAVERRVRR